MVARYRYKKVLVYLFIVLVFVWIIKRIVTDIHSMHWDLSDIRPGLLLAACLVLLGAYLIRSVIWVLLFRSSGTQIAVRPGMKLFLLTQAGRYLPGKIWQFVGAGILANTYNVPAAHCVSTTLLAVLLNQGVGILVAVTFFSSFFSRYLYLLSAVAVCALAGLVFVSSPWFPRLLNAVSRLVKRPVPKITVPSFPVLLIYAAFYAGIWFLFGLGFMYLSRGLVPGGEHLSFLQATGALAAACVAGYLSLFAPSGLGVREAILTLLLSPVIGEAPAAMLALAARVWMTLVEVIVIGWAAVPVLCSNTDSAKRK